MRRLVLIAIGLCLATPAVAQIGNFFVDVQRDPAGRVGRFIGLTVQGGGGLAIRCIDGLQSLAFTIDPSYAPRGQAVDVQLSFDGRAPRHLSGKVIASTPHDTSFQVGGPNEIAGLDGAGQVSMTYALNGVTASYLFNLIGSAEVVRNVQAACPQKPAS